MTSLLIKTRDGEEQLFHAEPGGNLEYAIGEDGTLNVGFVVHSDGRNDVLGTFAPGSWLRPRWVEDRPAEG